MQADCPPGTFAKVGECAPCRPGSFSDAFGASECTDCTQVCPGGPDPTTTCGGHGDCNQDTCGCECDPCHELAFDGTCVEQPDLACPPQRSIQIAPPQCWAPPKNEVTFPLWDPANWNGGKQCVCKGYWTGTLCDVCSCPGGVTCNDVTGSCQFTQPCDPNDPSTQWDTHPADAIDPAWWFSLTRNSVREFMTPLVRMNSTGTMWTMLENQWEDIGMNRLMVMNAKACVAMSYRYGRCFSSPSPSRMPIVWYEIPMCHRKKVDRLVNTLSPLICHVSSLGIKTNK